MQQPLVSPRNCHSKLETNVSNEIGKIELNPNVGIFTSMSMMDCYAPNRELTKFT